MADKVVDKSKDFNNSILLKGFYRLRYGLYNIINSDKFAKLKKHDDDIVKSEIALNKAKEKIKQQMIESDKSPDNSVLYTAITNFQDKGNKDD